ncbi:ankyrin repeat domain-containing protein [Legionella sp. CNM-4043-24]|uniref:ankyrin repeat domain-containing protein n=1 Tax=Legionella sp. CNM-4043-24 TaxID=3421646 RepID=UPI00403B368C
MALFTELQSHMELNQFKEFILMKLQTDERFLHQTFWMEGGQQLTVLNYLIMEHDSKDNNLVEHMSWLIEQGAPLDLDQPIHLAFQCRKEDLIAFLLRQIHATQYVATSALDTPVRPPFSPVRFALSPAINDAQPGSSTLQDNDSDDDTDNTVGQEVEHRQSVDSILVSNARPLSRQWQRQDQQPQVIQPKASINSRDDQGRTLVSHAIELRNIDVLKLLMQLNPNPNQKTNNLQALHEAVKCNFADAVEPLVNAGAQIHNPCGAKKETPLILAARYGAIDAMQALLRHIPVQPGPQNPVDTGNKNNTRAIDLLCKRLNQNKQRPEALRGIAMLLCHGAEAPRSERWCKLLQSNRRALIAAVAEYKKDRPELVANFYRAAHNRANPLHEIIFADRSFLTALRHFFGRADRTVFKLEKLVPDNADRQIKGNFDEDEQWFAELLRRYRATIKTSTFYNPYSDFLWSVSRGVINNRAEAERYCDNHPNSRTARLRSILNRELAEAAQQTAQPLAAEVDDSPGDHEPVMSI